MKTISRSMTVAILLVLVSLPSIAEAAEQSTFHFNSSVVAVDFSPGGDTLAVATERAVYLLDVRSAANKEQLKCPAAHLLRFNRSGDKLLILSNRAAYFFHIDSRRLETFYSISTNLRGSLGERLAIGANFDGGLGVFDPDRAVPVAILRTTYVSPEGQQALSFDRKQFAVLSKIKRKRGYGVELFDVKTAKSVKQFALDIDSFYAVKFSPDNSKLLIATNRDIRVIDIDTQDQQRVIARMPTPRSVEERKPVRIGGSLAGATVRSTGDAINSGSRTSVDTRFLIQSVDAAKNGLVAIGDRSGHVSIWSFETGDQLARHSLDSPIEKLLFSDDGDLMAVVQKRRVCVLNTSPDSFEATGTN